MHRHSHLTAAPTSRASGVHRPLPSAHRRRRAPPPRAAVVAPARGRVYSGAAGERERPAARRSVRVLRPGPSAAGKESTACPACHAARRRLSPPGPVGVPTGPRGERAAGAPGRRRVRHPVTGGGAGAAPHRRAKGGGLVALLRPGRRPHPAPAGHPRAGRAGRRRQAHHRGRAGGRVLAQAPGGARRRHGQRGHHRQPDQLGAARRPERDVRRPRRVHAPGQGRPQAILQGRAGRLDLEGEDLGPAVPERRGAGAVQQEAVRPEGRQAPPQGLDLRRPAGDVPAGSTTPPPPASGSGWWPTGSTR